MVTSPPPPVPSSSLPPSPSLDAPVTLVALVTPKINKENSSEDGLKLQENQSNRFFEIKNYTIVLMI